MPILIGPGCWRLTPGTWAKRSAGLSAYHPGSGCAGAWYHSQVFPAYHGVAWYGTPSTRGARRAEERVLIRFGAVDYLAEVWLNGNWAGSHEGGETPFELDVTELIHRRAGGENLLTGHHAYPTGYACGPLIAMYRCDAGRLILNTSLILENLDQHPAADRLLVNLVQEAAGTLS